MKYIVSLFLALAAISCGSKNNDNPGPTPGPTPEPTPQPQEKAMVYTTTKSMSSIFKESQVNVIDATESLSTVVLNPSEKYQVMDGFGAAMTWATCYNMLKMTAEDRHALLVELFDKEKGLGISLVRVSVGASDFNIEEYTWCDQEGLENFKIDRRDEEIVIPVLKEMYAINPDVKIIASPWSTPKWMKMGNGGSGKHDQWTSGRLDPKYYEAYAQYFVKWINVMQGYGFKVTALTPQNEPLNHGNSMSTYMPWKDQRDFIKTALGPGLEEAGLDTRILLFDHNYNYDNQADQKNYPLNIFKDPEASKYSAGSAWHDYGGSVSELDNIVKNAPDKDIYFTESSIGEWNYSWDGCILNHFKNIFLGTMQRGCKGITLWNMVLDDKKGPYSPQAGSCKTCYGAVEVSSSTYKVTTRRTHYYQIAHASKVVKPGAVRIGTSGMTKSGLTYMAFQNPDGSFAVLALNESGSTVPLSFVSGKHAVKLTLAENSITSILWKD